MILILCDKFKGTLTSEEAAHAIAAGLGTLEGHKICIYPMADGGEGTAAALGGKLVANEYYSLGNGEVYVPSCGEGLAWDAQEGRPLRLRTTNTLGATVRKLVESPDVTRVYLGIGGTRTADAGLGMLEGMDYEISRSGSSVKSIVPPAKDLVELHRKKIVGLADVQASLNGSGLSALSFLPQKGAQKEDVIAIKQLFSSLTTQFGQGGKFSGAGGGIGYALETIVGCRCVAGAEVVLNRILDQTDISTISAIITGEGCYDAQTAGGKVVRTIQDWGRTRSIPVVSLNGTVMPGVDAENAFGASSFGTGLPQFPAEALQKLAASKRNLIQKLISND